MLCASCFVVGVDLAWPHVRNPTRGFKPIEDPSTDTGEQHLSPLQSETRHSSRCIFVLMLITFIWSVLESIHNYFPFLPLVIWKLVECYEFSYFFLCSFCFWEWFVAVPLTIPAEGLSCY